MRCLKNIRAEFLYVWGHSLTFCGNISTPVWLYRDKLTLFFLTSILLQIFFIAPIENTPKGVLQLDRDTYVAIGNREYPVDFSIIIPIFFLPCRSHLLFNKQVILTTWPWFISDGVPMFNKVGPFPTSPILLIAFFYDDREYIWNFLPF